MKPVFLHILNGTSALCSGKRPAKLGAEPCPKCMDRNAKQQAEQRKRERDEQQAKERAERLERGEVIEQANGIYALRYRFENKIVTQSLGERDKRRAEQLAPLCMARIRRTGRKLRDDPTCFADA